MKADERTRTVNLLITNQLLCQLSHIGVFIFDCVPLGNMVFFCDTIIFGNVFHNAFLHLVGPTGLEPVTPCL